MAQARLCGCLAQAWSVESSGVVAGEGTKSRKPKRQAENQQHFSKVPSRKPKEQVGVQAPEPTLQDKGLVVA